MVKLSCTGRLNDDITEGVLSNDLQSTSNEVDRYIMQDVYQAEVLVSVFAYIRCTVTVLPMLRFAARVTVRILVTAVIVLVLCGAKRCGGFNDS